jgi:hypothetical protein
LLLIWFARSVIAMYGPSRVSNSTFAMLTRFAMG